MTSLSFKIVLKKQIIHISSTKASIANQLKSLDFPLIITFDLQQMLFSSIYQDLSSNTYQSQHHSPNKPKSASQYARYYNCHQTSHYPTILRQHQPIPTYSSPQSTQHHASKRQTKPANYSHI